MKVILVTRDGKARLIKEKLARHLVKAGKGYIQDEENFIAEPAGKAPEPDSADLFSGAQDGDANEAATLSADGDDNSEEGDDEPLVSDAVKQFAVEQAVDVEKVQGTGRKGRVKRADVQAYKTRMLSANAGEQSYQTTDLASE